MENKVALALSDLIAEAADAVAKRLLFEYTYEHKYHIRFQKDIIKLFVIF